MQCVSDLCKSVEWIHDWHSVVEKHAQTMLQLLYLACVGKPGELEQIVNIPVPQIVEEIAEVNIPVPQIVEEIAEVNIPVPQIVEEIAEVSKSLIVWSSILNLHLEEIKVFPA